MYSTLAYFLAAWLSSTLTLLVLQPLIHGTVCFMFVGFKDSSLDNFFQWLSILTLQGLSGSTFGFFFGNTFADPVMVIIYSIFSFYGFYFGCGAYTTYQGKETFLQWFFNVISPFKYAAEIMMTVMLNKVSSKDKVLELFDMDVGKEVCYQRLIIFFVSFFVFSWISLSIRAWKL